MEGVDGRPDGDIAPDGEASVDYQRVLSMVPHVIALGSIYGLATSIVYSVAFFSFSGNSWALGQLTIVDLFDRAIAPMIFSITYCGALSLFWYFRIHRRFQTDADSLLRNTVIMAVLLPLSIGSTIFAAFEYKSSLWFLEALNFIFIALAVMLALAIYWRVPRGAKRSAYLVAVVAMLPVAGSVTAGVAASIRQERCNADVVKFGDGTEAVGSVIFSADRGLGMSGDKVHALIPWERVARVNYGKCEGLE